MNYYAIKNNHRLFIVIKTSLPNVHNILKNLGGSDRQYLEDCFEKKKWNDLGKALRFFNKPRNCKASITIMCKGNFSNKRVSMLKAKRGLYGVLVEFNKSYPNPEVSFPVRNIDRYLEILDLPSQNLLIYDLPSYAALWYQRYNIKL